MTKAAIEIEHLTFIYPHSRRQRALFADFSWTVREGEFWVIIGANGSGKTTLTRLLRGLEQPKRGSIQIMGKDLYRKSSLFPFLPSVGFKNFYAQIGHVPQHLQFDRRLPITVLDVVEGGCLYYSFWQGIFLGLPHKQRIILSLEVLRQVGLQELAKVPFSTLSGGQKQRVLIARALVSQAPILILDEPTASIDPSAAQEIVETCHQLSGKHTIIFITHDITMIPDACEYIMCLNCGKAVAEMGQGNSAHFHDVRGLDRKQTLLLLHSHWGLRSH